MFVCMTYQLFAINSQEKAHRVKWFIKMKVDTLVQGHFRTSTVCWVTGITEAEAGAAAHDRYQSGCTCTAMMPHICQVDKLICSNHHVTTDELCYTLSIGKGSIMVIS